MRGAAATREVTTTSNVYETVDHYPVLAMPEGSFVTHINPPDGTGKALGKELVAVSRDIGMDLVVIGSDGTPVNTGVHKGAMRVMELELGRPLQRTVCGLHLNELGILYRASNEGSRRYHNHGEGPY